jgi:hypothetical protein
MTAEIRLLLEEEQDAPYQVAQDRVDENLASFDDIIDRELFGTTEILGPQDYTYGYEPGQSNIGMDYSFLPIDTDDTLQSYLDGPDPHIQHGLDYGYDLDQSSDYSPQHMEYHHGVDGADEGPFLSNEQDEDGDDVHQLRTRIRQDVEE